jgi:phage terminase small subunit
MPESQNSGEGLEPSAEKRKGGRKARELTEKQKRFAQEYVLDYNATKAAIRAGYKETNADNVASALMAKSWVKDEIDRNKAKVAKKIDLSLDTILAEFKKYAFANSPDAFVVDYTSDRLSALKELKKHVDMERGADGPDANRGLVLVDIGRLSGLTRKRKAK